MKAAYLMRKIAPGFLIAAALLAGCDHSLTDNGQDQAVKYSARSPNGVVKASLVTEGFGATVPDVYSVRLRPGDRDAEEVIRADHVQNLTLHWKDDKHLEINMDCGRIFRFTNFVDVLDKNAQLQYVIDVRLLNTSLCDIDQRP